VRARVCQQLHMHPGRYSGYVTEPYGPYIAGMARLGTWGDHVTLQAAGGWGTTMSFGAGCGCECRGAGGCVAAF
jgi:hypothetical protein